MNKMLYIRLNEVKLIDYYSPTNNELKFFQFDSFPYFFYPDSTPCYEANSYIIHLVTKFGGYINSGTIRIYSNYISHLIRYIYNQKIESFTKLNDDTFSKFINHLQFEMNLEKNQLIRSSSQVISIGKKCIDFLIFIRDFYSLDGFIGLSNAYQICVKKVNLSKNKKQKYLSSSSYSHVSFPLSSHKKKRYPISNEFASKIYKFVSENPNFGLRIRNTCLLDSLEQTGARRMEILQIRTEDVRDALRFENIQPMLKLRTLKTKKNSYRIIPVPKIYLQNLSLYIRRIRRNIIDSTIGLSNDHGYVFISHTTGKPLSPDTFTTYMNNWAKQLGLDGPAFAHLYRHRFITEKFKSLIQEHQINSPDSFRQLLMNTNKFQQIMQQWTGHTSIESLNTYINLAYEDLSNVNLTIHNAIMQ